MITENNRTKSIGFGCRTISKLMDLNLTDWVRSVRKSNSLKVCVRLRSVAQLNQAQSTDWIRLSLIFQCSSYYAGGHEGVNECNESLNLSKNSISAKTQKKLTNAYYILLYKHQWNTKWPFARKHDIFTREDNMLFSHVKRSLFLWLQIKMAPFDAFPEII